LVIGVAGALAARAAARADPEIPRGETLLFRTRPRKVLWRNVSSLGLWELTRRTTLFAVTNRRVIIDRGLVRRTTRSIPLSGIVDVSVMAGPWQGVVEIAERGGAGAGAQRIGPLRSPVARGFAAELARAIAR
jgi:hypothetical protein